MAFGAAAAVLAAVSAAAAGPLLQLKMMPELAASRGAVCLDGTPAGFYIQEATEAAWQAKWVLWLNGGGWCYNAASCADRARWQLGSSTDWDNTTVGYSLASTDCGLNPTFCKANIVVVPYCDGASFSGNADAPVTVAGQKIFFRGRRVLDAVLDTLRADHGLGSAEEVLLSGCSAGGLSTYIHADTVGDYLRVAAPGMKKYKAAPVSGFFLDAPNRLGTHVYRAQMQNVFEFQNAAGGLNRACLRANPGNEWRCIMAPYVYPHIATPIFMLNSALDSWQTSCVLGSTLPAGFQNLSAPFSCDDLPHSLRECFDHPNVQCNPEQLTPLLMYGRTFMATAQGAGTFLESGNGAFIDSCHLHCEAKSSYWSTISTNGVRMCDAVAAWWGADDEPAADHTHFPCELKPWAGAQDDRRCNPTCPKDQVQHFADQDIV